MKVDLSGGHTWGTNNAVIDLIPVPEKKGFTRIVDLNRLKIPHASFLRIAPFDMATNTLAVGYKQVVMFHDDANDIIIRMAWNKGSPFKHFIDIYRAQEWAGDMQKMPHWIIFFLFGMLVMWPDMSIYDKAFNYDRVVLTLGAFGSRFMYICLTEPHEADFVSGHPDPVERCYENARRCEHLWSLEYCKDEGHLIDRYMGVSNDIFEIFRDMIVQGALARKEFELEGGGMIPLLADQIDWTVNSAMRAYVRRLTLTFATRREIQALLRPCCLHDGWEDRQKVDYTDRPTATAKLEAEYASDTEGRELAFSMMAQLMLDAKKNRAYAIHGTFEIELPATGPLYDDGLRRMRLVAIDPDHLCIAFIDAKGCTPIAIRTPHNLFASRRIGLEIRPYLMPYVMLAVAALYHDLVVAGPVAIRHKQAEPHNDPEVTRSMIDLTKKVPKGQPPAIMMLPRPRFEGKSGTVRNWGSPEERAAALAHIVRGHYRRHEYVGEDSTDPAVIERIQHLREEAANRARLDGMASPPLGRTYVRSHRRGIDGPTDESETPETERKVYSTGLRTMMAVFEERQATAKELTI